MKYDVNFIKNFYGLTNVELAADDINKFKRSANVLNRIEVIGISKYIDTVLFDENGSVKDTVFSSCMELICFILNLEYDYSKELNWNFTKQEVKEYFSSMKSIKHTTAVIGGIEYTSSKFVFIRQNTYIELMLIKDIDIKNLKVKLCRKNHFCRIKDMTVSFDELIQKRVEINDFLSNGYKDLDYNNFAEYYYNLARIREIICIKQSFDCFERFRDIIRNFEKQILKETSEEDIKKQVADNILSTLSDVDNESISSKLKEKIKGCQGGTLSSSKNRLYSIGYYQYSSKGLTIKLNDKRVLKYSLKKVTNFILDIYMKKQLALNDDISKKVINNINFIQSSEKRKGKKTLVVEGQLGFVI